MAISGAHPRGKLEDAELARLAGGGGGDAFAELYDRNERRVYAFCVRMLGTPHDAADATQETFVRMLTRLPALQGRELDFLAYTLATARNVCYDMIRSRRTLEPTEKELPPPRTGESDIQADPERFALLAAAREDVRAANAALPPRQREVLALREVELLSYDAIGELMDLNRNAVAQLISRARIKLAELLRGSALASVGPSSPECERALPLLASLQDEQQGAPGELDWIRVHLSDCDTCRLSRAAMEEAGTSYRALALLVPALWLRRATIARAAEAVGADWSEVADRAQVADGGTGADRGHVAGQGRSTGSGPTSDPVQVADLPSVGPVSGAREILGGRGRLALAALLVLGLCVVLALVLAGSTGRDGATRLEPVASSSSTPPTIATTGVPPSSDKLTASHGGVPAARLGGPSRLDGPSGRGATPGVSSVPAPPAHKSPTLRKPARQRKYRRRHAAPAHRAPASKAPAPVAAPAPAPATTTATQTTPSPTPAPSGSSGSATSTTPSPAGSGSEGSTAPTTPTNPNSPPGLIP